jgi:hypothetical protein
LYAFLRFSRVQASQAGGGFINKDKPFQIQRWLFFPEGIMGGGDIVLVLLGGMDVLFLKGLRGIEWVGLRA